MLWKIDENELFVKVIFFGPLGSGKRTTLEELSGQKRILGEGVKFSPLPPERELDLGSNLEILLATQDSVDSFSFLPLRIEMPKGPNLRFLIFAVHSESDKAFDSTVFGGVDAFVFIVNSELSAINSNLEAFEKLQEFLNHREEGDACPIILQLNKRDLPNTVSVDDFRQMFPSASDYVESVACKGIGTREALKSVVRNLDFSKADQI